MIRAVLVGRIEDSGQLLLGQRRHLAGLMLRLTALPLEDADGGISRDAFLINGCVQHRAEGHQDVLERVPTEACLAREECPDVGPLQLPERHSPNAG